MLHKYKIENWFSQPTYIPLLANIYQTKYIWFWYAIDCCYKNMNEG